MRVMVCVTGVADPSLLGSGGTTQPPQLHGGPPAAPLLNPADQAALSFARTLAGGDPSSVQAVHVGPARDDEVLREALAFGAADALLVETAEGEALDAPLVAGELASLCAVLSPEWVLCGQATLDWGNALVAGLVAGRLGWPLIDHVVEARCDGERIVRCERVVGRGARDELRFTAPAVIAASPLAFQPTIAPLRDRLRAQRAAIARRPACGAAPLPRAVRSDVVRPRPRPKAALPPGYSEWSPDERLAYMTQTVSAPRGEPTRWLDGSAPDMASAILDFVESAGVHLPWAR